METRSITTGTSPLTFAVARRQAEEAIQDILPNPMLIAWYDGQQQQEHPEVPECQHQPGWLAYAEGHGGQIRVDINEGEFSFIFANASE